MNRILPALCIAAAVLLASCQSEQKPTGDPLSGIDTTVTQTGGTQMITIDGKYRVWTRKVGDGAIKLLLLHGGPAMTHEYFECFESFLPRQGVTLYYYDQLGSAYSDQPQNDSLWTVSRFVEEVDQVRQGLGLTRNDFYLLGHSWGGILAMEYALKYQRNLKGLVISNMMASCPAYAQYNKILRSQMRKSLVDSLRAYEYRQVYKDPVYVRLVMNEFYTRHVLRRPVAEWPEPVNRSFAHVNDHIYTLMQGPNEFGISGRLANWDRMADLESIRVPTLVIGARYDTMDPYYMADMSRKVLRGRYLHCPRGSHLAMWDDQPTYFRGLINFLRDVDQGTFEGPAK